MSADRKMRLWQLMVERADGHPVSVEQLCLVAIDAVGVTATAITVTLKTALRETLFATDQLAADMEELALTLGEGPCVDAELGDPALVPDLLAAESLSRWPVFADSAAEAGVRAVFALPLQIGAIRVGVLDLFRTEPGELEREQLADALVLAETASALLLDASERAHTHPDGRAPEITKPHHPEVHQATGMIAVQLGVTVAVALIRLRAYAYAHERMLHEVARDIVGRRLRFEFEGGDGIDRNV